MKSIHIFLSISFCLSFFAAPTFAQKTKKDESADETYDNLGYKASIRLFESKEVLDMDDMSKLANAYRMNHDTENAEFWYSQVVDKTNNVQDVFHYAQALQNNGRYKMAKHYYLKYDEMAGGPEGADQRGRLLARAIDRMNEFQHTAATITNESLINTEKLDFSPTYYKDGIIFVSTRSVKDETERATEAKDDWIEDNYMALFYARANDTGELDDVREFALDITSRYHEGPISISRNGERIYFTRNDYTNEKRRNSSDGIMKLQIYTAVKDYDGWSEPMEMPFNTVEYDEAHPALSPDGGKIYFSSNRAGGKGGMDLYVSEFKNGKWNEAKNMGPEFNTPGNEVFPYVHDDGTLYFASNGWAGLGGLDIYSSTPTGESTWTKIKNIGTPFNSKKDDFGFVLNLLKTEGYLSSARRGGRGKDDIYSFVMPPPTEAPIAVSICAYEKGTETKISDVQFEIKELMPDNSTASVNNDMLMTLEQIGVTNEYILKLKEKALVKKDENVVKIYNTNQEGTVETFFKKNRNYVIIASKEGFQIAEEKLEGASLEGVAAHRFCIPLEKSNCVGIEGLVKHEKYGNAIPGATVIMTNLCTGDDEKIIADANGAFVFPCVPCACDFILKGQKSNFVEGFSKQSTSGENCKLGTALSTTILLANDVEKIEALFEKTGKKLEEGAIVELENIYYDFDQFYIREDAKDELDHVVNLLKKYPAMTIELASHTDARASSKYNEKLSQNRANAAVQYIVSQGIASSRLVAQGYGERSLKNRCADSVDCTEEEHQRNRRTEIKILKLDNKNIEVKYIDNQPEKIDSAKPSRKSKGN